MRTLGNSILQDGEDVTFLLSKAQRLSLVDIILWLPTADDSKSYRSSKLQSYVFLDFLIQDDFFNIFVSLFLSSVLLLVNY